MDMIEREEAWPLTDINCLELHPSTGSPMSSQELILSIYLQFFQNDCLQLLFLFEKL